MTVGDLSGCGTVGRVVASNAADLGSRSVDGNNFDI